MRKVLGIGLSLALGGAAMAQPADITSEGRAYWSAARAASAAPPQITGCLSPAASRRVVGTRSALAAPNATPQDEAAWLAAWTAGASAYAAAEAGWRAQAAAVAALPETAETDDAVRSGLAARSALDEAVRGAAPPAGLTGAARDIYNRLLAQAACRTGESNTRWLKTVVTDRGWPDRKRLGPDADHQAWRLVQHAETDPAWQRDALVILRGLLDTDATDPANVAYLADRVAITDGRQQRFGTQGSCIAPGRWIAEAVNTEEVDERRAELGMGTFIDYAAEMAKGCR